MPNGGPPPAKLTPVLAVLRTKGELGATSRELMQITPSYQEVLSKLRHQGYSITTSNANMPAPYHCCNRYTLHELHEAIQTQRSNMTTTATPATPSNPTLTHDDALDLHDRAKTLLSEAKGFADIILTVNSATLKEVEQISAAINVLGERLKGGAVNASDLETLLGALKASYKQLTQHQSTLKTAVPSTALPVADVVAEQKQSTVVPEASSAPVATPPSPAADATANVQAAPSTPPTENKVP